MSHRRALSVLLAAAAAAMLVTGSFGFTSVSAERGVSVAVVDSENAYVNATACEKSKGKGAGSQGAKVTVTNQFSSEFTVDEIRWNESAQSGNNDRLDPDEPLSPGESKTFNNAFADGELTVVVSDGLDATVSIPVEGQCGANGGSDNDNDSDDEEDDNDNDSDDEEDDNDNDSDDEEDDND